MKKIQLGIRGGGVKSLTSIGVLIALEEEQIKISEISGTSIGSVVAALYSVGYKPKEIYKLFKDYLYATYINETRIKGGKGNFVIRDTVNQLCKEMLIGKTKIPITISANCGGILTPQLFVFDSKNTPNTSLGEACQASSSFPFLYKRFKTEIDGKLLKFFDGGMVANPLVKKKEDNIFVLSTFETQKVNTKSLYLKAWQQPEKEVDIIIKPFVGSMRTVGTAEDMVDAVSRGYEKTKMNLKSLKEIL